MTTQSPVCHCTDVVRKSFLQSPNTFRTLGDKNYKKAVFFAFSFDSRNWNFVRTYVNIMFMSTIIIMPFVVCLTKGHL